MPPIPSGDARVESPPRLLGRRAGVRALSQDSPRTEDGLPALSTALPDLRLERRKLSLKALDVDAIRSDEH